MKPLEHESLLCRTLWVGSRWNPLNISGFSVEPLGCVLDETLGLYKGFCENSLGGFKMEPSVTGWVLDTCEYQSTSSTAHTRFLVEPFTDVLSTTLYVGF